MSDRVHAAMHTMEAPKPKATIDRVSSQPQLFQLPPPHHSMLPLSQLGDPRV